MSMTRALPGASSLNLRRWVLAWSLLALACARRVEAPETSALTPVPHSVDTEPVPCPRDQSAENFAESQSAAPDVDGGAVVVCEAVYVPSFVALEVALPIPVSEQAQVEIRVCLAASCVEFSPPRSGKQVSMPDVSRLGLRATARAMSFQRTHLNVQLDITRLPELHYDGVELSLIARHASRGVLLDVRRPIRYERESTACNGDISRATLTLARESESGLDCTGHGCLKQGFELRIRVPSGVNPANAQLVFCRNSTCSEVTLRSADELTSVMNYLHGVLEGGAVVFHDARGFFLHVFDWGSAFELNAADHYRLELLTHQGTRSWVLFDRVVEYDTYYPNGPACDRFPCRYMCLDACGMSPCVRRHYGE